jgi:amino acid adenylation domain-containing protein
MRAGQDSRSVIEMFIRQTVAAPSAIAVVDNTDKLTYGELARQSRALAVLLCERDVRRGDFVAVRTERPLNLLVALLGVIRAGAAYVPLNPDMPATRRNLVLRQSQATIIIADADVEQARREATEDGFTEVPERPVELGDAIYALFTSGSTGIPKGVVLEHRGISNILTWMAREYRFTKQDRVLQKTPSTFDASVWELFLPLIVGGTVVMAEPGGHRDPRYLVDAVRTHGVTTLQLIPSMLRHVLDHPDFAACSSLRHVFCGGEPLPRDLQRRFHDTLPVPLVNLYGPTETSVQILAWTCSPGDSYASVPIGRPIDNVTLHVLDDTLAPVPDGTVGELFVGGPALARGYLNDSQQTARSFVPDPFRADQGRLYRTGDLVRRNSDGVFEYAGRQDEQVKINGQRVELGDIEFALRHYPGIEDAAVLTGPADHASTALVAYLRLGQEPDAAAGGPPLDLADLRRHLAERLPSYMIPQQFRLTAVFPHSAHGKLDKSALAKVASTLLTGSSRQPGTGRAVTGDSELERKLTEIWQRTLSQEVRPHDDFFELGGTSMAGLVMIAHAREQGIVITPKELFRLRTIAAIAAAR